MDTFVFQVQDETALLANGNDHTAYGAIGHYGYTKSGRPRTQNVWDTQALPISTGTSYQPNIPLTTEEMLHLKDTKLVRQTERRLGMSLQTAEQGRTPLASQ